MSKSNKAKKSKFGLYKQAFLGQSSDVEFFKRVVLTMGKCISVIPPTAETKVTKKITFVLMVVSFAIYSLLAMILIMKRNVEMKYRNMIRVIQLIEQLSQVVLTGVCIFGRFRNNSWNRFFHHFEKMEAIFNNLGFRRSKKLYRYYIMEVVAIYSSISILHLIRATLFTSLGTGFDSWRYQFINLNFIVAHFYVTFILIFIRFLATILTYRYKFIQKIILAGTTMKSSESEKFNAIIDKVHEGYETMSRLVEELNIYFRWQMFFFLEMTLMLNFYTLVWLVKSFQTKDKRGVDNIVFALMMTAVCFTLTYLGSALVVIISCNNVEKSNEKLIEVCNLHRSDIPDSRARQKILALSIYAADWKPTFSAGGFFDVNITTISSMFSALIAYLIVALQFDLN